VTDSNEAAPPASKGKVVRRISYDTIRGKSVASETAAADSILAALGSDNSVRASSISDLAEAVDRRLRRDLSSPGVAIITRLLEAAYFTSLKTEEGRPVQCRIALVNPAKPDPDRPPGPNADRWKIIKLASRLPLTVSNLVKLSKAADPWSSCLAAYFGRDRGLFIWGLVDQVVHSNTYLVHEKAHAYAPPGLFQVVALGTADLSVYREHEFIARLAQDRLSRQQSDVFWSGPVAACLDGGIGPFIEAVWREVARVEKAAYVEKWVKDLRSTHSWDATIAETWIGTICRVLISIQRYRHGGALLITRSNANLGIKYRIRYPRLRAALTRLWTARLRKWMAEEEIEPFVDEGGGDWIPVGEFLDKEVAGDEEHEVQDEVTGCVRFISSLSCVDGLVLADPDLVIRGFGVEIRTRKDVEAVYLASGPKLRSRNLKRVNPNHYGTRHRSMMRFCFAHPGSLGFVVSQDGDIRVITRVRGKLIMWENPKVLDFTRSYSPESSTVPKNEWEDWQSVYNP
jgi:hypothetical protein